MSPRVFFLAVFLLLVTHCVCESHYSILGVSKNAKIKEIKKAYVRLAKQWHPDKNKGENAKNMMSKINKAYEILSDEDKRRHYDLLEYEPSDDDYKYSTLEDDDSSHESTSTVNEINTEQFMNSVLPASERTPYLIYFFHDFCEKCEEWTEDIDTIKKDMQSIGVGMASVNVIVSNKVAGHCDVYVHEVPQLVVVINRKPHPFTGFLSLDNVKQFIHDELPSKSIKPVDNADDILSMETRIVNNKPVVLLVSPQETPSLEYKLSAYQYQQYMLFYFLSSLPMKTNVSTLEMFNVTENEEVLLLYSDTNDSTVTLKGKHLNKENMIKVFDSNKWLSVPRVNSCAILDELCPVGNNKRSCVLLVANGNDKVAENFRAFVRKQSDFNFSTGILNPNQNSTLRSALPLGTTMDAESCGYDSDIVARPVVIIRRPTTSKLEYSLLSNYCGTDNSRLLELLRHSNHAQPAVMSTPCSFEPEQCVLVNVYIEWFNRVTDEMLRLFMELEQIIDSRVITVTVFGLTSMGILWLLCKICRKKHKPLPIVAGQEMSSQQQQPKIDRASQTVAIDQTEPDDDGRGRSDQDTEAMASRIEDKIMAKMNELFTSLQEKLVEEIRKERQAQSQVGNQGIEGEQYGHKILASLQGKSVEVICKDPPTIRSQVGHQGLEGEQYAHKIFASLRDELVQAIEEMKQYDHDSDTTDDENDEGTVKKCKTDKVECEHRNDIIESYIRGRDWDTSQMSHEFSLLRIMIRTPQKVPGWEEYYKKYPLIYDWEWESSGSGKGDLLCTDGENRFLVVELKSLVNSGKGLRKNQRNRQKNKRKEGKDQAEKFAKAWHDENPQVKSTTGILVTNEETREIVKFERNIVQPSIECSPNEDTSKKDPPCGDRSNVDSNGGSGQPSVDPPSEDKSSEHSSNEDPDSHRSADSSATVET